MNPIKNILLVMLGSGLGGALRLVSSDLIRQYFPSRFPVGTFFVNILGCLLIGIFWGVYSKDPHDTSGMKLLLTSGFCGGFTTFSAFAIENLELIRNGNHLTAFSYVTFSILVGISATFIGSILFK